MSSSFGLDRSVLRFLSMCIITGDGEPPRRETSPLLPKSGEHGVAYTSGKDEGVRLRAADEKPEV